MSLDHAKIEAVLQCPDSADDREISPELNTLPLALGNQADSPEEADYVQALCLALCERKSPQLRKNAILGLAYLANNRRYLDKTRVWPVIRREWERNPANRGQIEDAIEDINRALRWNMSPKRWKASKS